jgi:hypothetical protein
MAAHQIKIGHEFFAKAKNDYDNWYWAIIREFFQNCIDCGSTEINVVTHELNGQTVLSVSNNGEPMTETIIMEKLFALGGSGKNFEGAVGGFGKAKEILYFCHKDYAITSGNHTIIGSGAEFDIIKKNDYTKGTVSTIKIDGSHAEELLDQIDIFINYAQWGGVFTVNGETRRANMKKGSPRRELEFGKVYTNKSDSYRVIIRIGGIPMFHTYCRLNRCVIVELDGQSCDVLTSNRDGLRQPYKNELYDFITEIAVDKKSALKNRRGPKYKQYRGTKLCNERQLNVAEVIDDPTTHIGTSLAEEPSTTVTTEVGDINIDEDTEVNQPVQHETPVNQPSLQTAARTAAIPVQQAVSIKTDFVLKNETDLKVPNYYDPGQKEFSIYSKKLVRIWGRVMLEMHRLFDHEAEFSIGFIFDDGGTEAEYENGHFGTVYYLNPCEIKEQRTTYSKSFCKRFKLTERDRLISIGLHEFVHGLGYGYHDEAYAGKLTDLFAVVMKERKRFNWCFK